MDIIPAIDLMNGRVVRLLKGNPQYSKEYGSDPLAVAEKWINMGASRLHIVDLDATLGRGGNLPIIQNLARSVGVPVQIGGGIRDAYQAFKLLSEGVDRIIFGTLAFRNKEALISLLDDFGSRRVAMALDYISDEVMIKGWKESAGFKVLDALAEFHKIGLEIFLLTAIQKDGTLEGPDYDTLTKASEVSGIQVIASGGIRAVADLLKLRKTKVKAAIIGRAIYEGTIDLREAIRITGDSWSWP